MTEAGTDDGAHLSMRAPTKNPSISPNRLGWAVAQLELLFELHTQALAEADGEVTESNAAIENEILADADTILETIGYWTRDIGGRIALIDSEIDRLKSLRNRCDSQRSWAMSTARSIMMRLDIRKKLAGTFTFKFRKMPEKLGYREGVSESDIDTRELGLLGDFVRTKTTVQIDRREVLAALKRGEQIPYFRVTREPDVLVVE